MQINGKNILIIAIVSMITAAVVTNFLSKAPVVGGVAQKIYR